MVCCDTLGVGMFVLGKVNVGIRRRPLPGGEGSLDFWIRGLGSGFFSFVCSRIKRGATECEDKGRERAAKGVLKCGWAKGLLRVSHGRRRKVDDQHQQG